MSDVANEMELEQRDRRINRLTSSVDDMEEGVAVGRVHIKKLTALLSKPPLVKVFFVYIYKCTRIYICKIV